MRSVIKSEGKNLGIRAACDTARRQAPNKIDRRSRCFQHRLKRGCGKENIAKHQGSLTGVQPHLA